LFSRSVSDPDHFAADLHKKLFFGSKSVSKETVAGPDPADADLCGSSFYNLLSGYVELVLIGNTFGYFYLLQI
jgi:hypothetical protein